MIALILDYCHESCLSFSDFHILEVKLAEHVNDCTVAFSGGGQHKFNELLIRLFGISFGCTVFRSLITFL